MAICKNQVILKLSFITSASFMYWGQIHRESGLLFDLWIPIWCYFVGWKTGGHLNCTSTTPSFEITLVNMPSEQSIWTFQIAASSYFPKTYYKLPHPNEVARNGWKWRNKLSGGIGLLDHLSCWIWVRWYQIHQEPGGEQNRNGFGCLKMEPRPTY